MPCVNLELPHHHYDIRIEGGLLQQLGELVREVAPHDRAALLVDGAIETSHGRVAARAMRNAGYETVVGVMPPGEAHKSLGTVRSLYDVLLDGRLERRSPVIALGGGITGDTAGFVAATYLRGVPFVQVPTTLLAMVDASVGGKVGVNVPQGKNLIGAFHQPMRVVIDPHTLGTLPDRELRCGLAECIKHGMIRDASLVHWIDANLAGLLALDEKLLIELLQRNVQIKADVVMADEKETGERAHLNFGHTFAHAIEAMAGYGDKLDIHHGEAVSLGMIAATTLAVDQGLCDANVLALLRKTLKAAKLPTACPQLPPSDVMLAAMGSDKKVKDGRIRLILPTSVGTVIIRDDIAHAAIEKAWTALAQDE